MDGRPKASSQFDTSHANSVRRNPIVLLAPDYQNVLETSNPISANLGRLRPSLVSRHYLLGSGPGLGFGNPIFPNAEITLLSTLASRSTVIRLASVLGVWSNRSWTEVVSWIKLRSMELNFKSAPDRAQARRVKGSPTSWQPQSGFLALPWY